MGWVVTVACSVIPPNASTSACDWLAIDCETEERLVGWSFARAPAWKAIFRNQDGQSEINYIGCYKYSYYLEL